MKYLLTFVRDQDRMYEGTEEEMKPGDGRLERVRPGGDRGRCADRQRGARAAEDRQDSANRADGEGSVTDGPFAETKEQLGGFCLIDCETLEDAIGWAKKVPLRPDSAVEVRAVMDLSPYGYESATPGPVRANATA